MLMAATAYQPQTDANTTLTTPPRSSLVPFHNGESSMAVSDVTDQSIDIQVVKAPINVNGNNTLSFHYELPSLRPPPHGYEQVTTFLQTAVPGNFWVFPRPPSGSFGTGNSDKEPCKEDAPDSRTSV